MSPSRLHPDDTASRMPSQSSLWRSRWRWVNTTRVRSGVEGVEGDLDLARLGRVGLDLPCCGDVPREHHAMRWLIGKDPRPRTRGSVGAVIDGATTDPRLELHAGQWSAKYVLVGVPPAADADREYLEGGRRSRRQGTRRRNACAVRDGPRTLLFNPPNHTLTWRSMTDIDGLSSSEEVPGGFSCQSP